MNVATKPEPEQAVNVVHKSVFEAVAACVPEVRTIGKSDRNKFDGYDFASIDKFLALVGPICGRHGLFPMVNLTGTELYENQNSKGGKAMWCRFSYTITLYHSSGEHLPETPIMVAVPMNGAQASGSAQSYALKQYFRSLFMIPTGDKDDADLIPTEVHQASQSVSPEQFVKLRDLAEQAGVDAAKICKAYDAQSFEQFPADKFDAAIKRLTVTIQQKPPETHATAINGDEIPY